MAYFLPGVGAVASQAQTRVLSVLEGADGPAAAVAYDPPRGMERSPLREMLKAGVVREAAADLYGLDRARMAERNAEQRRAVTWVAAGAALLAATLAIVVAVRS